MIYIFNFIQLLMELEDQPKFQYFPVINNFNARSVDNRSKAKINFLILSAFKKFGLISFQRNN